mmetsp:Transcript_8502/g.8348  ORF Transcript_8502/g.8348 Transcript_8502/m.8348 type:complete len:268 (-) Transcript_8502:58-861(-)
MSLSKSIISADRAAIRQALAILDGDDDTEIPSSICFNEGMTIRFDHSLPPSRKAVRRVPWSPKGSCSSSYEGNSSSNSLRSERNREVGDKGKQSSHAEQSKHPHTHKYKKANNSNSSSSVKSVRFSKYDQIHDIPHINDFTQEEIDECWMNEEDYHFIRSRSYKLIDMMEDGNRYPISADTIIVHKHLICIRGLEGNTSQKQNERGQRQKKIQTAVYHLQQQQKEDGVINPQAIRQVSKKYSKEPTKNARFVGISDECASVSRRHSN